MAPAVQGWREFAEDDDESTGPDRRERREIVKNKKEANRPLRMGKIPRGRN